MKRRALLPQWRKLAGAIALHPVRIRREGREVTAVSLPCNHLGCRVGWSSTQNAYICPYHDGTFDAEGLPLAGPHLETLDRVPMVFQGDRVCIGPLPRPEQAA